jgi:glycosyltransferase involved in cell wall biosynthesis
VIAIRRARRVREHLAATAKAIGADVVLKTDGAGWILDEFCRHIQRGLRGQLRVEVVTAPPVGLRRRVVHFTASECFYDPQWSERYHESNAMIGLWWHGTDTSPEPSIRTAAQRIAAVSAHLARVHVTCTVSADIVRRLGVDDRKIALVPMGVDRRLFGPPSTPADRETARRALGIPADSIVVGSFQKDGDGWSEGNAPKRIKGPDVLVAVMTRLSERHRVVALLPGPARGYVKRELTAAGVSFCSRGVVPAASMRAHYHACDLYVMTGREEGGPASLLEALACGTPVVAHRAGMAPDVIADGVNGYLADVDDIDALVMKADRLIVEPDRRAMFANAGLETARRYDWANVAPLYRELYESVRAGIKTNPESRIPNPE